VTDENGRGGLLVGWLTTGSHPLHKTKEYSAYAEASQGPQRGQKTWFFCGVSHPSATKNSGSSELGFWFPRADPLFESYANSHLVLYVGPFESSTECFPSGWQPTSAQYFSPGVCPAGYTSACFWTNTSQSGSKIVTETVVTCLSKVPRFSPL
jgi:hypothetical protein